MSCWRAAQPTSRRRFERDRDVRALILLLLLACAFGGAALWQQLRTQRLREERALAAQVAAGKLAMTPSGVLGTDEGVVVVGRPALSTATGLQAGIGIPGPAAPTPAPPSAPPSIAPGAPGSPGPSKPAAPPPLGDFVMEVGAGQSLSQIAHDHYGHAPVELVTKLAQYNGMSDANALKAGMKLKLPPLERLGVVLKK